MFLELIGACSPLMYSRPFFFFARLFWQEQGKREQTKHKKKSSNVNVEPTGDSLGTLDRLRSVLKLAGVANGAN